MIANRMKRGEELMPVKDMLAAEKAFADKDCLHVCPYCEEGFNDPRVFASHAPDCIKARAPRYRVFPMTSSPGMVVAYSEKRPHR
jgi:hypothetical protein